jgi:hypothetical protein
VQEINKSRKESRSIVTAPVSAEQVCFPLAEQAALLLRQTEGRKDELAALIIAEFLLDNQLKTEAIFTEALRRAQGGGELSDKQDPTALARFFVVTIQGMRAMAKLTRIVKRSNRSQE